MAENSADKKVLSRRSLFSMAGGAAGLLLTQKLLSSASEKPATKAKGARGASAQNKTAKGSKGLARAGKPQGPAGTIPQSEAPVAKPRGPVMVDNKKASTSLEGPADVPQAPRFAAAGADVRGMLTPLRPGAKVYDWTVVAIHDMHFGAIPVILSDKSGQRFQVDVLRRDRTPGAPKSVADTARFSLFLANKGDGRKPSDEKHGLGAIALATVLSRRSPRALPAGLLTWRERLSRFPHGEYNAPV